MTLIREDQYSVTAALDGVSYGVFDKFSGGELDSTEKKYRPGGMGKEISVGGSKTTSNVVISRAYDLQRDHTQTPTVKSKVGKGIATVVKQPLDADGFPFGTPEVYVGTLKRLKTPDHDSNGSNEAMVEWEISTNTSS